MKIKPYNPDDFDDCIAIFVSNLGHYFAEDELPEFKEFLMQIAYGQPYFVLLVDNQVVACGGYEKGDAEIGLTWGMVKRAFHGHGYGKALTRFRLNEIRNDYRGLPIVIDTSQHTKGFYEKRGFMTREIKKDSYEPGLDMYIMARKA